MRITKQTTINKLSNYESRRARQMSRTATRLSTVILVVSVAVIVFLIVVVEAATKSWDGGTTGNGSSWATNTNWAGDIIPATGDDVVFDSRTGGGTIATPMTVSSDFSLRTMTFDTNLNAAANLDTNGSGSTARALTLTGDGTNFIVLTSNMSGKTLTFRGNNGALTVKLSGTAAFDVEAGALSFGSAVAIADAASAGGINKTGAGTLTLSGANTYTGTSTVTAGTMKLSRSGGTTIPTTNNVTVNGGTLEISTNQTINDFTMTSGTLLVDSGATLTINGSYSASGGTINNQGTIKLGGASASFPGTGVAVNNGTSNMMSNLEIATSGTVTLTASMTISSTLTLTSGTFSIVSSNTLTMGSGGSISATSGNLASGSNGGTVAFAGTGTVSGTVGFNNVTLAGSVNFGSSSTVGATMTINSGGAVNTNGPTYGSSSLLKYNTGGNFTIGSEWVNGTSGQGVPQDVQISNSGGALNFDSISSSRTARGSVTIDNGTTLQLSGTSGGDLNVQGSFSNNGSFDNNLRTVTFNGSSPQTIGGSTSSIFQNLTINSSSTVTLNTNATTNGALALTSDLKTATNIVLTMPNTGTSSGSGDVVGSVKRTGAFAINTEYSFGNPNVTIAFTTLGTTPTDVTINLDKIAPSDFANAIARTYTVTPNGGSLYIATLKLHYLDTELNGNAEGTLKLWRKDTSWTDPDPGGAATTRDPTNNWVSLAGVTQFSKWTLAAPIGPTAVKLASFTAGRSDNNVRLQWQTGYEVRNLGFYIYREQNEKRTRITPSLVAGSALLVGRQTVLTAGFSYTWYDQLPADSSGAVSYWLEDVDLSGARTLHGPIVPASWPASTKAGATRSQMLNELQLRAPSTGTVLSGWPAASIKPKAQLAASKAVSTDASISQSEIAATPGVKITVSKAGWYRITQPELAAAGLDANASASQLQLFENGAELPIKVSGNGTQLTASDYLEFYGQGSDSTTDAARTYYLLVGNTVGKRIGNPSGGPTAPPSGPTNFDYTSERRDRWIYYAAYLNGDAENIFGHVVTGTPAVETLTINHPDVASATQARLEVSLVGLSLQNHHVRVSFNGQDVGTIDFTSDGHPNQVFNIPASLVHDGDNTVQFRSLGGDTDTSLVDIVRLTYAHTYTADNDSLSISVNSSATTRVSGFSNGNLRAVDVTDANNLQEIAPTVTQQPDGTFAADLCVPGASLLQPHILLVFSDMQAAHPDSVKHNDPSAWSANPLGADYLIITSSDFVSAAQTLAQYRHNKGFAVSVIDVEDLYDEFTFGAHSPLAIRAFLQTAATSWSRKPHFVLLMGDASYDPKNYLGQGNTDFVPTKLFDAKQMETASDDWLADFDNDGIADLAIGRLPVRTSVDANMMVNKIISYETAPFDPQRGALLVADRNFESSSAAVQNLLPQSLPKQVINRSSGSDSATHTEIINAINQGPKLVNYLGHGSNGVWTGALLLSNLDAPNLTNSNRLSLFVMMTCLNGYFPNAYNDGLAEALMRTPTGGAVAVWASSGMTEPQGQDLIAESFYQHLFSSQSPTLGDAVLAAKAATTDLDVRRTWTLFGDPAMQVARLTPTATSGTVTGVITDSQGAPLAGTTISLGGAQTRHTITDGNGSYSFEGLDANGFYTVTPSRVNYSFTPGSRSFSLLGSRTEAAFTGTLNASPINPLDTSDYFVRQHYLDFLGREPDESGFNFWSNQIRSCGNDPQCVETKRINTSAAFFLSVEFQQTGYLVYRTYKSAYGNMPNAPVPITLGEFQPDTKEIGKGVVVNQSGWEQALENNKQSFMSEFVQRERFSSAYPTTLTPSEFVDKLFANSGVTPTESDRLSAINEFASASTSSDIAARARALRRVSENSTLAQIEFNRAFVLMQYFGYLRRNPVDSPESTLDYAGYDFWLNKLNRFNGNFIKAEMVRAFIMSGEYRQRFSQ